MVTPLTLVTKKATNNGDIKVIHCQPEIAGAAINDMPTQRTISPK
tara:strand:+ start:433 stop:567 length:135 start_codon:yes stop_codon:yes gene_type:complete